MGAAASPGKPARAGTARPRARRRWVVLGVIAVAFLVIAFRRDLLALLPPPAVVADRSVLPSCGVEVATSQDGPWNSDARDCFWSAYLDGQPAEFISTRPTVEGARITTIYRIVSRGTIEVIVDARRNQFASRDWTILDCPFLRLLDGEPAPNFGPGEDCDVRPID